MMFRRVEPFQVQEAQSKAAQPSAKQSLSASELAEAVTKLQSDTQAYEAFLENIGVTQTVEEIEEELEASNKELQVRLLLSAV